jgi:hypothetical protein
MLMLWWLRGTDAFANAFQMPPRSAVAIRSPASSLANGGGGGTPNHIRPFSIALRAAATSRRRSDDGTDDEGDGDANNDSAGSTERTLIRRRNPVDRMKRFVRYLTPIVVTAVPSLFGAPALVVPPAHAGAPVMAIPKTKMQDPVELAFEMEDRKQMQEAQSELQQYTARGREIEREQGPEARERYEKEYKLAQEAKVKAYEDGLKQLKYDLLDAGIIPTVDLEGQRQIVLYTRGVDLGEVEGTPYYLQKLYEKEQPEKSLAHTKKANREIVKYMVQDLKNRGLDPLDYFEKREDKAEQVLGLPPAKAIPLAEEYAKNIELYGQIAPPKEGEKSAKELMAERGGTGKISREEQRRLKAEAKAEAAAAKAEAKAKAMEEKARIQAEKRAANEAAKKEKEAAIAAAAAAAAAPSPLPGSLAELNLASPSDTEQEGPGGGLAVDLQDDKFPTAANTDGSASAIAAPEAEGSSEVTKSNSGVIKIIPASAALLAVGGGAFAVKAVRDRSAAAEAERQRQFKLLMGGLGNDTTEPIAAEGGPKGSTLSDLMFEYENQTEKDDFAPDSTEPPAPKKRKSGLKSVFRKKKNDRDTDITVLVAPGAKSPEFAKTLAKILTFGAPGRFPEVVALPGDMPMETFDFDAASEALHKAQEEAGLSKEESAEVFADVVNCMLIDIVDLASTSLKEKDDSVTVNAINIVVEFMDHAASLFNSIAEGVTIEPVTYGGDIGKGKLEQMYVAYATSGMYSMSETFGDKLSLLQSVFQINENKAEGIVMKAMQKNLMEMMKNGKMPEGTEDFMKEFQGLPGLDGDEDISPAQLKEMLLSLKELKEDGKIPSEQWVGAKKEFEDAFGGTLDELVKAAQESGDEMTPEDKELLDLMESVFK